MRKLLCLFLVILSTSCEDQRELSIVEKIARANGIEDFGKVTQLRYTFNVKVNDSLRSSRTWLWNPQQKTATLAAGDSTVTYNYSQEADQHKEVDHRFINDQYWLLFPFHLVWDDMEWEYIKDARAPISGQQMQQVTITYPQGGYTPGDMYEIYFKDDHIIQEWVYLAGGSRERPLITTWEQYQSFNGIKISTLHRSEDGAFELFFTDVHIEF